MAVGLHIQRALHAVALSRQCRATMAKLRSSHFRRGRTFLKRPAAVRCRPAAATLPRPVSREINREHIKRKPPLRLATSSSSSRVRVERQVTDDDNPTLSDISRWSQMRCRKFLEVHGLHAPKVRRTCWKCGSAYRNPQSRNQAKNPSLRCSLRSCDYCLAQKP